MTAPQTIMLSDHPSRRHASAEEWEAFVRTCAEHYHWKESWQYRLRLTRRQFVDQYPDLETWFATPLTEQVGRSFEERAQRRYDATSMVSYQARPYLGFLAVRGYAAFDWEWLIAAQVLRLGDIFALTPVKAGMERVAEEARALGWCGVRRQGGFQWAIYRLVLHTADPELQHLTEEDLLLFKEAILRFRERSDVAWFFGSHQHYLEQSHRYVSQLNALQVLLYHRGQVATMPPREAPRPTAFLVHQDRMKQVLERYLATRRLTDQESTVRLVDLILRQFVAWIEQRYPTIETFAQVTRDHLLEYADALTTWVTHVNHKPLTVGGKRLRLAKLAQFFREVAEWGWEDVPPRPLLQPGDLPKLPQRVPRYIPEEELGRLMTAIRALECPYQRASLLIARWSGARRGEIHRLSVDCLDQYPDGTPRLRLPTGKTYKERMVPIADEAAEAIRTVQACRNGERGLRDPRTGLLTRYLFMQRGRHLSLTYLFDEALQHACTAAGLLTPQGKPTVTPHRFRHTVGTQLVERGARLRTVMKVLGHDTAHMSVIYAQISDKEVLKDYQAVLGPGATIAGPSAAVLRSGELPASAVEWLKGNFLQTELELGRCLRLPQEGPCECDLYLTCAKFVTTPEYAPRLRRRRTVELELIEAATVHGWQREVERHLCTVRRLEQLLADLGQPLDGPEAAD